MVNGADAEDVDTAAANAESASDDDDDDDDDLWDEYDDDEEYGDDFGEDNPFAPAEDYLLSDALDGNAGDLMPAVTMDLDYLLYDSPRKDPLGQLNAQVRNKHTFIGVLASCCLFFPNTVAQLSSSRLTCWV